MARVIDDASYGVTLDGNDGIPQDASLSVREIPVRDPSYAGYVEESAEALGEDPGADEFKAMARVEEITSVPMPKNLRTLKERPVRHRDVIGPDDMLQYLLDKAVQEKW